MAEINNKTTLSALRNQAIKELTFFFFLIKMESRVTDKKRQILETLKWEMKFYGGFENFVNQSRKLIRLDLWNTINLALTL